MLCILYVIFLSIITQISAQCIDHQSEIAVYVDCKYETRNLKDFVERGTDAFSKKNMLEVVEFKCDSNNTELCGKVRNAFEIAGLIISKAFKFRAPILVNASFVNFCNNFKVCGKSQDDVPIGMYILMKDDDGVERLYPQALVKQFKIKKCPQFAPFDIKADFNSAANWWFKSDVLLPSKKHISKFNAQLNLFAGGPGAKFQNKSDFDLQFRNSTQYNEIAKKMFNISQTAKSMGFLPRYKKNAKKAVILETSLIPYIRGSSISHVDFMTYVNTSDFLMRYSNNWLDTLDGCVTKGGKSSYGPIGPRLRSIMESLGYATARHPKPYRPTLTNITRGYLAADSNQITS
ncbi:15194_t:CDS:2 [Racocetra fulgida]|uniref:15194_t:CDS:1 n=1 Tax=Racocetra fulgida TaxID=60492 RepID=A0A9N9C6I9_9GLOM|nr:15194_t:CDS:2 [Racocetra fulgida]